MSRTPRPQDVERRRRNGELVALMATADDAQRDQLVDELALANLEVARSVARRYTGRSEFGRDLEQVAYLALVKAARDFDPARGHEFLAYAVPCMAGAVKHFYRDSAWTVRPPRAVQDRHVAEQGLTEHVAHGVEVESCFRPWSLDAPLPGDVVPLGATLAGDDRTWEQTEVRLLLWQHLRTLSPKARQILHQRFVEDRTQQEIADELGVSQYHVSRLLSRYLRQLREQMTDTDAA